MPRNITDVFRSRVEDPHNPDPALIFVTLDHADLDDPIRVVSDSDKMNYVLGGDTYVGFPFKCSILSDGEDAPRGKLMLQNVDRSVGLAAKALTRAPSATLEIYLASDWDLTVVPRVPLGTPARAYRATGLFFRQISVDAVSASGSLESGNFATQPWPSIPASQGLLPCLFRG
jgi:hypothetical protein